MHNRILIPKGYFRLLLLLIASSAWILSCSSGQSERKDLKNLKDYAKQLGVLIPNKTVYAPNFRLNNLQGKEVVLDSFRGKIVFLHFSTTW